MLFLAGVLIKAVPLIPGGPALIALGASMVSRESHTAADWLDRTEVRIRTWASTLKGRLLRR